MQQEEITWLGRIEQIGNKSVFVRRTEDGSGYRFQCNKDERTLVITEVINGDSSVILSLNYDDDGYLVEAKYYSESYDSTLPIEDDLNEWLTILREDGVVADGD